MFVCQKLTTHQPIEFLTNFEKALHSSSNGYRLYHLWIQDMGWFKAIPPLYRLYLRIESP